MDKPSKAAETRTIAYDTQNVQQQKTNGQNTAENGIVNDANWRILEGSSGLIFRYALNTSVNFR